MDLAKCDGGVIQLQGLSTSTGLYKAGIECGCVVAVANSVPPSTNLFISPTFYSWSHSHSLPFKYSLSKIKLF